MGISKLPKGLFVEVISSLETRDKLNCIYVSRHSHEVIRSTCLYANLVFRKRAMDRFKLAFTFLHKYNFMGKQVTQLDVYFENHPDMYTMLFLPRLMPNLQTLKWSVMDSWRTLPQNAAVEDWDAPFDEACLDSFGYWKNFQDVKLILKARSFPMEFYALAGVHLHNLKRLEIGVYATGTARLSGSNNPKMRAK